jgi:hypothetical protein
MVGNPRGLSHFYDDVGVTIHHRVGYGEIRVRFAGPERAHSLVELFGRSNLALDELQSQLAGRFTTLLDGGDR